MQISISITSHLLVAACMFSATNLARGEVPIAYDEFEYPATPNLLGANGGMGWASQWFDIGALPTGVAPEGLTWPGLLTRGGCATTAPFPSSSFARYSRALAAYTDPDDTVYLSFLVRPNIGYGTTGGLAFGTWDNGMVIGVRSTGVYGLMTPPDTAHSDTQRVVVQGETTLLVARIHKNTDATITWSLFTNAAVSGAEPAQPEATLTIPGSLLPPAVFIYNDGGFSTDEIRLGHTWPSVLPPATILGDVTGDGVVNVDDLLAVITAWGTCPAAPPICPPDVNGDGFVNVDDLLLVITHWG